MECSYYYCSEKTKCIRGSQMVNSSRLQTNEITIPNHYPVPNIEDIFDKLRNVRFFTTLHIASGFHQIPVLPADRPKTAFSTHEGHFQFNKMPFGLRNAPATFQRIINDALNGLLGNECFVYIDIIIYSKDFDTHIKKLHKVFGHLPENNLLIQSDKSELLQIEITYLVRTYYF